MARDHRPAARNAPPAPVAFVAAAAIADGALGPAVIAPTEPPPEEAPSAEELTTALTAEKIRAAALEGERDELLLRVAELEAALTDARGELAAQCERFNAAWAKREAELTALSPEHEPPIAPRRPIADAQIPAVINGVKRVLMPGDEIPEGVDTATLPKGTVR